jgi:uncharacterized membrane protein YidH (DUF202 family)
MGKNKRQEDEENSEQDVELSSPLTFWSSGLEVSKKSQKKDPRMYMRVEKNFIDWLRKIVYFSVAGVSLLGIGIHLLLLPLLHYFIVLTVRQELFLQDMEVLP